MIVIGKGKFRLKVKRFGVIRNRLIIITLDTLHGGALEGAGPHLFSFGVESVILVLWPPTSEMSISPSCGYRRPGRAAPTLSNCKQRQIAKHGTTTAGMPPLLAYEGSDGALELYDGVTRATRV